ASTLPSHASQTQRRGDGRDRAAQEAQHLQTHWSAYNAAQTHKEEDAVRTTILFLRVGAGGEGPSRKTRGSRWRRPVEEDTMAKGAAADRGRRRRRPAHGAAPIVARLPALRPPARGLRRRRDGCHRAAN